MVAVSSASDRSDRRPPPGSGPDVYVHFSAIAGDGYRNLDENDQVEFEVTSGPKGPNAADVRRIG